ncbi:dihydrofolate reductase family protein [Aquipuribacter sp. SD81]|uniref:dihydrofolate reductase family protein n=1 Tax=Aquipuribacter sp. SD81 TaxID=3127703 RepID=UPI00301A32B8
MSEGPGPVGLDVLVGPGAPGRLTSDDVDGLLAHYTAGVPHARASRWVRANMVSTVDGAATGPDGRSGSVSSDVDKAVFGLLRGLADAVLVGAGTARSEGYGPAGRHRVLAARREAAGRRATAVVVQVTRSGRVETGRGMFEVPEAGLVVMPAGDAEALARAREAAGEDGVVLAGHVDDGGPDLARALDALAERGLRHVLCEGGPGLLADVAAADVLDELCLTTSPLLVASDAPRVTAGAAVGPHGLELAGLLHARSTLLARWLRRR